MTLCIHGHVWTHKYFSLYSLPAEHSKWIIQYIQPVTFAGSNINIIYSGFQNSSCKLFQNRYGLVQGESSYYTFFFFSSTLQQVTFLFHVSLWVKLPAPATHWAIT